MASSQHALAEQLGVSQMTISRALRGDPGVSSRVRTRVLRAAQEVGYPLAARFRRNNGSMEHVVCSIVDIPTNDGGGNFNARILSGIEQSVHDTGAEVMNYGQVPREWCENGAREAQWPRVVTRRQVDGVVHLFGGDLSHLPRYTCPVPLVSIFFPVDNVSDLATVDNIGGGQAIGAHLGKLAHRHVAFIGPTTALADDRLFGLRRGLKPHGGEIPEELVSVASHAATPASVRPLLDALLPEGRFDVAQVRERFTAIAVYNDDMAAEVIEHLDRRGLRVPEDISVTGFDNAPPARYRGPKITTAAIPLEELGAEAARLLYWRIDFPDAPRRTLMLDAKFNKGGETTTQAVGQTRRG